MGSITCKQQQKKKKKKKGKKKKSDVALAFFPDMSSVNCQLIYAMNTRDINTKSFEFCGELMISFIKPHMNNQLRLRVSPVTLRNPSGYTLIKL